MNSASEYLIVIVYMTLLLSITMQLLAIVVEAEVTSGGIVVANFSLWSLFYFVQL